MAASASPASTAHDAVVSTAGAGKAAWLFHHPTPGSGQFKQQTGVDVVHLSCKGTGPATKDVVACQAKAAAVAAIHDQHAARWAQTLKAEWAYWSKTIADANGVVGVPYR